MTSEFKKLNTQPDGKVHWTAHMDKLCQAFKNAPCPKCGGKLQQELGFAENQAYFAQHRFFWDQTIPARLQLLQWYPSEAIAWFIEPFQAILEKGQVNDDLLKVVLNIHDEKAIDVLIPHLNIFAIKNAVAKQAKRWPLYVLQKLLQLNPGRNQPTANLIVELLATNPSWTEPLQSACDDSGKKILARLLETEKFAEASLQDLPAIIRQPPWRIRRELPQISELNLAPQHTASHLHWPNKTRQLPAASVNHKDELEQLYENWFARKAPPYSREWSIEHKALFMLGANPCSIDNILETGRAGADDFPLPPATWCHTISALFVLPRSVAEQVLQCAQTQYLMREYLLEQDQLLLRQVFEHVGEVTVLGLRRALELGKSRRLLSLVEMIEADSLALPVAEFFCRNKWAKSQAFQWLSRYPEAAVRGLVPVAFGPESPLRQVARQTLRSLIGNGFAKLVRAQAAVYGTAALVALSTMEAIAPEEILPDKLPTLPKTLHLPGLPRLILKADGKAIPLEALPDVLMTLMLSKADEPYGGLAAVQDAVTPDSLARLGQALFKWWQNNGSTTKDRWMFEVQGLIGNDETARQLSLALRQWRAALNRVRAYEALNMLAQIGSDIALMYLHALHQQTRHADLHERAGRMMNAVAEARSLTQEQLADRTVPDLGLDAAGKLVLDFGPRQFTVNFDESLLPYLKDSEGKRLKDLPKPNGKDDATQAKEAASQYKDLKKQAKSIAGTQIKRLEAAMCARRRWTSEEFMVFFVRHPLLHHLSQRLIWGVFDEQNQFITACRIAEDLSLSDVDDDHYTLPEGALVGIAHRLELPDSIAQGFGQRLADYQVIQPFPQLGRETYSLPQENASRHDLPEWQERRVTTGSLLGLEQRGWNRVVGDGGMVNCFAKPLAKDLGAFLAIEEGWFIAGDQDVKAVQVITQVRLSNQQCQLAQLDAIVFSEMQRDLHLMAWFTEP